MGLRSCKMGLLACAFRCFDLSLGYSSLPTTESQPFSGFWAFEPEALNNKFQGVGFRVGPGVQNVVWVKGLPRRRWVVGPCSLHMVGSWLSFWFLMIGRKRRVCPPCLVRTSCAVCSIQKPEALIPDMAVQRLKEMNPTPPSTAEALKSTNP